jgi:hypothetical protein
MKKIIFITILFKAFLFFPSLSFGEEPEDRRIKISVHNLGVANYKPAIGKTLTDLLRGGISANETFLLLTSDKFICKDNDCAVNSGKEFASDLAIIGTITRSEIRGNEALTRYVDKSVKMYEFTLKVSIINISSGKTEHLFIRTAKNEEQLKKHIIDILVKLRGLYNLSSPKKEHEMFKREVITDDTGFGILSRMGFSIATSYLTPTGAYSNIADDGFGLNFSFIISFINFKDLVFMASRGYYELNTSKSGVKSILMRSTALCMGYYYPLNDFIGILPHAGVGYIQNIISGQAPAIPHPNPMQGKTGDFFDPSVIIGCEIDFAVYRIFYIFITPSYTFFFEKENTGQFVNFCIGAKLIF